MELNIEKQSLILNGKRYTYRDIKAIKQTDATDEAVGDLFAFLNQWFDASPYIKVHSSGSTGQPKEMLADKQKMIQSARMTCEYLNLKPNDTALLCMNLHYIGAMMMVVRALVAELNLIVNKASRNPLSDLDTKNIPTFAAMAPIQVYNTLSVPEQKQLLQQIQILIIGGGHIDSDTENTLAAFPNAIYSTYGMTETLSHIALRRINGVNASKHYRPLAGISLTLAKENTLVINAPMICDTAIHTNDMAKLFDDGSFVILGRTDNVINSGGIKIQIEEIENILRPYISVPFAVTSSPDKQLGEAMVLLLSTTNKTLTEQIRIEAKRLLPPYFRPKRIVEINEIPTTDNGKTDRNACRKIAAH